MTVLCVCMHAYVSAILCVCWRGGGSWRGGRHVSVNACMCVCFSMSVHKRTRLSRWL